MDIKSKLKNINLVIVLILVIPVILNILWFKDGNILGTGESGLPFYDFNIQHNINKDAWAFYALGYPINIGAAAAPTYWVFAQLQNLGIPEFTLQAIFLWLIFTISGVTVYKLLRELFPSMDKFHSLLAVLFYWFNPFSLVNVWNRFLNNFLFFYALLPLSIYFFIKGLRSKSYIYAILIGLVSAIFSYALTSIAFNILLWGLLLYFGLFYFFTHKLERFFVIKFFLLAIFFWFLANSWWISQVFSYLVSGSFDAVANTSFKTDSNYSTFYQISQRLGILTYIFRLKHASFFENFEQLKWVGIYQFPLFVFFEFLVSGIVLMALLLKKQNLYILMFGGLFLVSLFLAKGNNPPLGEIFDKLFLHFSFLQLFRNPLEKFGFILSFSASILFAIGSFEIERFLNLKWKRILRVILICWILLIWGFPFWSGYVFTNTEVPRDKVEVGYKVRVPSFYKDASEWLNTQKDNFRLAIFPVGGEGITYLWEKGYSGVELSNQLLPKTSISFNTNIPFFDGISSNLERILLTRANFSKIMDVLNTKYILIRTDIDWRTRGIRNPASIDDRIEKIASGSNSIEKVQEFDKLSFWESSNWKDKSIYLTNNLIKAKQTISIEDLLNVETDQLSTIYNGRQLVDDKLIKSEIIHPYFKFSLGAKNIEPSVLLREDIIFPAIRILPSEPLYPLILIKERLEFITINDQKYKIIKKISFLGKRLVEAEKEAFLGQFEGSIKAIDNYEEQLNELYLYSWEDIPQSTNELFLQEDLYKVFQRHFKLVEQLMNKFPSDKKNRIISLQKSIKDFVTNKGIKPILGYMDNTRYPLKDRIIYQFAIEKEGSYELLFNLRNWNVYFKQPFSEPILFQIDDNLVSRTGRLKENGLISFGFFNLDPGKHEVGWNIPEQINLINAPSEFLMTVDHGLFEKSFPIKNFDPYSTYILSVDYLIKRGNGIQISIEENNDPIKEGVTLRQFSKNLSPDIYNFSLRNYTAYYLPSTTSDIATMFFSIYPWNNCEEIYWTRGKEKCKDEEFRRPYNRTTEVLVQDVSLVKLMTEVPFLRLEENNYSQDNLPEITFTKINNAEYKADIKKATNRYALILSELYDPAWKVLTKDGVEVTKSHFLANSYANGWIIDKKGDYEIFVKFTPQDLFKKGQTISIISLLMGVGVLVTYFIRVKNEKK